VDGGAWEGIEAGMFYKMELERLKGVE